MSAALAPLDGRAAERELAAVAAGGGRFVAGPWMGEVGFELLYWVPFLAWFAERFRIEPSRLVVISRGGTAAWYRPFAGEYRDVFDHVGTDAFKAQHHARVREIGEQKQTRLTAFERGLVDRIAAEAGANGPVLLHPSVMYRVFRRFWWGHVGTGWVHRHARYRRLAPPPLPALPRLPDSYVAMKFYFNDCFPATPENRAFARRVAAAVASRHPVVSLSTGLEIDDHDGCHVDGHGVLDLAGVPPSRNLEVQSAVVAHARAFVGTYGGFAYLAPFHGVPCTAYFSDPNGFSRTHLDMAHSALDRLSLPDLLQLQSTAAPDDPGLALQPLPEHARG